jgi:hypothetical protein
MTHDTYNNIITNDVYSNRLARLLIFMLLNFVLVRYALAVNLTDIEQIKIVLASSICFMFVTTYYPVLGRITLV